MKKQKHLHDSIKLIWLFGFVYSLSRVGVQVLIVIPGQWRNWWAQLIILVNATAAGLEHWLFSLEYYTSASKIAEQKNWISSKFFQIFWTVSAIFFLLEVGACIGAAFLAVNLNQQGVQVQDTIQVYLYLALNIISNILIVLALIKLNEVVKKNQELKNNRTKVGLHILLFTTENLLLLAYVIAQTVYQSNPSHSQTALRVATRFHFASLCMSVMLNCFIAWMLLELSKPSKTFFNSVLQRQMTVHVGIRTTNALVYLLQLQRTHASEVQILDAFRNYEELAKRYEQDLFENDENDSQFHLDERMLSGLVDVVANETAKKQGSNQQSKENKSVPQTSYSFLDSSRSNQHLTDVNATNFNPLNASGRNTL